jgi:hypothetical protein
VNSYQQAQEKPTVEKVDWEDEPDFTEDKGDSIEYEFKLSMVDGSMQQSSESKVYYIFNDILHDRREGKFYL